MSKTIELRVLVIEEEPMIRIDLEAILLSLGYEIAAQGQTIKEAMALARDGEFDVAILDVRVQGHYIFPVADILIDRNLPFIFATTLMPSDTPARHRNRPLLEKPFELKKVHEVLSAVLAQSSGRTSS